MKTRRWLRWLVAYPLLIIGGCHTLLTGSPIPLWHIERLNSPVHVVSIERRWLVLENGRRAGLPFISRLPADDVLFRAIVGDEVEVSEDGEVFGLVWLDRICGNDPYVWRRVRVNLSDLAGAIDPDGIDPELITPDSIEFIRKTAWLYDPEYPKPRHYDRGHLNGFDCIRMRTIRRQFEGHEEPLSQ